MHLRVGVLVVLLLSFTLPSRVMAVSDPFDPSTVISDAEFNDTATMSCGAIQDFLTQRTGVLKSYVLDNKSAAQIICENARRFGINARLLLVLLQKEQGLLGDTSPDQSQFDWAAGCAPGMDEARGLANQLECAARTMRNRFDSAPLGVTIDGVTPANRATIALFRYNNHVQGVHVLWRIWTHYWPATGAGSIPTEIFVDSRDIETTPSVKDPCRSGWLTGAKGFTGYNLVTPNANGPADSTNTAVWRPNLPRAGAYQIYVYIPDRDTMTWPCSDNSIVWDTSHARYTVTHRDGTTTYEIDQAPLHNAWVNIGTYYFNQGTNGFVTLTDQTGEDSMSHYVSVDEAKWVWVGQ